MIPWAGDPWSEFIVSLDVENWAHKGGGLGELLRGGGWMGAGICCTTHSDRAESCH